MKTLFVKEKSPLNRHTIRLKHHFRVRLRHRHQVSSFLKQTVAAQIHAWGALGSLIAVVVLGQRLDAFFLRWLSYIEAIC